MKRRKKNASRKKSARGGDPNAQFRVRTPQDGEFLGQVIKILGAGNIQVKSTDGKIRVIRIPGKYRKRMWVRPRDIVAIYPDYGLREDERGELRAKYNINQVRWLIRNNYISEDFIM
ncbi:MAG: translation initiation factor 1A [Candidatus Kariarchaeaceae archaeon]